MSEVDKLLKRMISLSNNPSFDSVLSSEDLQKPENLDLFLALKIGNSSIACTHFTHHKMVNPSSGYKFANNPGIDSCSNPLINSFSPPNSVVNCAYVNANFTCPQYNADYSIIKKVASVKDETLFYYLTKFKDHTGTYFYSIYDSAANLYFKLSYTDITDSDLDTYALSAFATFLNDLMLDYNELDVHTIDDQIKSSKNSYLSTIFSS